MMYTILRYSYSVITTNMQKRKKEKVQNTKYKTKQKSKKKNQLLREWYCKVRAAEHHQCQSCSGEPSTDNMGEQSHVKQK